MPSFLFTSCYNVMSYLTSILCVDNRTTLSETSAKTQCIFCWRKLIFAKTLDSQIYKFYQNYDKREIQKPHFVCIYVCIIYLKLVKL